MTGRDNGLGRLVESALSAASRVGHKRVAFSLAGRTIRLDGAGPALIDRIAPAFAHLPPVAHDAPADLTVLLWDTASTGQPLPDLGRYRPVAGAPVTPILHGGGRSFVFHAFENAMSYLDGAEGVGVYVVEDAAELPSWERACPLRSLLTWWLAPQGLLLAHGAAVGDSVGAALLAGPGGSGKSTAALWCLAAGMGYLGDDYVLLDSRSGAVWSVYASAKLSEQGLALFPGLLPGMGEPAVTQDAERSDVKLVGWPAVAVQSAMVLSAPARAVVVPRVTGGPECRLAPQPASRALLAVAPLTMFQTVGDAEAAFRLATRYLRGLPTFSLELGAGMERVPAMIESIISSGETSA